MVVLGTVAAGVFARAEDLANKSAKRTSATRVNIVKPVPLEVTVSNVPLGVVAELPPVDIATLRLFVENRATPSNRCLAFLQTGPTMNVVTGGGSSAPGFGTTGMFSGFVVGSGARIVADLRTPSEAASSGTSLAAFTSLNATVVVRGYLVKVP